MMGMIPELIENLGGPNTRYVWILDYLLAPPEAFSIVVMTALTVSLCISPGLVHSVCCCAHQLQRGQFRTQRTFPFFLSEGENRYSRNYLISTEEGKLVPALLSFLIPRAWQPR